MPELGKGGGTAASRVAVTAADAARQRPYHSEEMRSRRTLSDSAINQDTVDGIATPYTRYIPVECVSGPIGSMLLLLPRESLSMMSDAWIMA